MSKITKKPGYFTNHVNPLTVLYIVLGLLGLVQFRTHVFIVEVIKVVTNMDMQEVDLGFLFDDSAPSQLHRKTVISPTIAATKIGDKDHAKYSKTLESLHPGNPIQQPILDSGGTFYILNRRDRSGRVVADMLYAHAFAFANNLTYGGLCWIQGRFKEEMYGLMDDLQWENVLPFACPEGVDIKKFVQKYSPNEQNATEISPMILNFDDFKIHSNFKPAWASSISKELMQHMHRKEIASAKSDESNEKVFEIAVHVRRGDIEPCKFAVRYLPNSHYLSLIDQYMPKTEELNGRSVHVTIYSESNSYEPFDVFHERGYSVELDTPKLADVWRALATADVAILSKSYFSMIPAIINPNVVVMTDYWDFEALEGWHVVQVSKEDNKLINKLRKECLTWREAKTETE